MLSAIRHDDAASAYSAQRILVFVRGKAIRDYQLRISQPMELEPRGFTLVRRISIVARDSDDAIAQAMKVCLADVSGNDQAILLSADEIDVWIISVV